MHRATRSIGSLTIDDDNVDDDENDHEADDVNANQGAGSDYEDENHDNEESENDSDSDELKTSTHLDSPTTANGHQECQEPYRRARRIWRSVAVPHGRTSARGAAWILAGSIARGKRLSIEAVST